MRRCLFGFLAGLLLSAMRAAASRDLFAHPVLPAEIGYALRAGGLLCLAIAAAGSRRLFAGGRPGGDLLVTALLGYLVHAQWIQPRVGSPVGASGALIGAVFLVAWFVLERRGPLAADPEPKACPANVVGLFIAGAGTAMAVEGVSRHVELFGAGLVVDDSVFASVFLVLVAFGALAFGRFLRSMEGDRARGRVVPIALALGAAGALAGLFVLQGYASVQSFDRFVRRFGLDTSLHGMLPLDALVSASAFVLSGFAIGTALYAARHRFALAAVLAGAAAGLILVPMRLASEAGADLSQAPSSALLVTQGTLVAAVGALVALALAPARSLAARLVPSAVAAAVGAWALAVTVHPVPVVAPWSLRPVRPTLMVEIPEGLVTVEPSDTELAMVTLNRRALSPALEQVRSDASLLALSFQLVGDAARVGGVRVLLVGQLTPGRALALQQMGAVRVDRTGIWHGVMAALESHLFAGTGAELPEGDVLGTDEARTRLADGQYDLVLMPPVTGETRVAPSVDAPAGTVVVAWLDGSHFLAACEFDRPVLLSAEGFNDLNVAVVGGIDVDPRPRPDRPAFVPAGQPTPGPSPIRWLRTRGFKREELSRTALAERLWKANAGGEWGELTEGLARHYSVQRHSSPFASAEEAVELDDLALASFGGMALRARPDAFTRQLWNSLARIFVGKRSIDSIEEYVVPIAEQWAPWTELEAALAYADLESLRPERALARLLPLAERYPDDLAYKEMLAQAYRQAGQHEAAAEQIRALLERYPDDYGLLQELGVALMRAGDPEGRTMIEDLLLADPENEGLRRILTDGPPDEVGFRPLSRGDHSGDDH